MSSHVTIESLDKTLHYIMNDINDPISFLNESLDEANQNLALFLMSLKHPLSDIQGKMLSRALRCVASAAFAHVETEKVKAAPAPHTTPARAKAKALPVPNTAPIRAKVKAAVVPLAPHVVPAPRPKIPDSKPAAPAPVPVVMTRARAAALAKAQAVNSSHVPKPEAIVPNIPKAKEQKTTTRKVAKTVKIPTEEYTRLKKQQPINFNNCNITITNSEIFM
jgi:hypothetical protein